MNVFSLSNPTWLAIYVVLLMGEFSLLIDARIWAMSEMSRASSHENWNAWKAETARQAEGTGPVSRRAIVSTEPPTLVLLRDYFWMLAITLWGLSTVLYVGFAASLRGAFSTKTAAIVPREDQDYGIPA